MSKPQRVQLTVPAKHSRRRFLILSGWGLSAALVPPSWRDWLVSSPAEWPSGVKLGRMTEGRIRVYTRPNPKGREVKYLYRDDVVVLIREIVGEGFYPHNHVWFETPDGYAYSSWIQPVRYAPSEALDEVPAGGIYVEVNVPFTAARVQPDPQSPELYRLYFGSTYQVSGRATSPDGSVWYRINDENVVKMFGEAAHFRHVPPEELAPLSPDVSDKSIVVSLSKQSLTAYEGKAAVFRARLSSGRNFFGPDGTTVGSLTPAGAHPLWSKRASRHMTGGTPENGYDLPGVPWVMYFSGNGAAIHGTYWHNDYGTPKSAGCLNVRPEDAKWLWRWTLPRVPYVPGHIIVEWPGGTTVVIQD